DEATRQRAIELRTEGRTYAQIATALSISDGRAYKLVNGSSRIGTCQIVNADCPEDFEPERYDFWPLHINSKCSEALRQVRPAYGQEPALSVCAKSRRWCPRSDRRCRHRSRCLRRMGSPLLVV